MKTLSLFTILRTAVLVAVIGGGNAQSQQLPPPAAPVPGAKPQAQPQLAPPGVPVSGGVQPGVPIPGALPAPPPTPGVQGNPAPGPAQPGVPQIRPRPRVVPPGQPVLAPVLTQGIYTYILTSDGQATIREINHQGLVGGLIIPPTLGECPVTRIGPNGAFFLPNLTSVTIPASVTSISDGAFSDCPSLRTITVAEANEHYCSVDGVLFNKDKTTLIQHPSGKAGKYVIPTGVTSIGSGALSNCAGLTEITIPAGVTIIGLRAFSNCTKLTGITIPASATSIQLSAFSGCDALTSIAVDPDNMNYSSVQGVLFSNDKTTLLVCPAAKAGTYVIPEGVTAIGSGAFSHIFSDPGGTRGASSRGSSFRTSSSGSSIGFVSNSRSFASNNSHACNKLTSITLPASLTNIGASEFSGCTALAAITVAAGNREFSSVDGVLFNKDQTELVTCPPARAGSYTIPIGVTSIQGYAFAECVNLTDIIIPNSVISISQGAFNGCRPNVSNIMQSGRMGGYGGSRKRSVAWGNYTYTVEHRQATIENLEEPCTGSISIPSALGGYPVTGIAGMAEADCTGPASITIPAGITRLASAAFSSYTGLKEITVDGANPTYSSLNGILFDKALGTLVQFPRGKSGTYEIPASVTSIELAALAACPGLTAITVDPANAEFSSRDGVLFNKDQTMLIQYPAGKAGSYTIPSGVTSISDLAFANCAGLTRITIPNGITERTTLLSFVDLFRGCTKLAAITVNETHPDYGCVDGVLFSKDKSTLILCPAGKEGSYAIPDEVTDIERDAFSGCAALTGVAIPASLTSLATPPPSGPISSGSSSIGNSSFGGGVAGGSRFGGSVFSGCTGLMEITVDQGNKYFRSEEGVLYNKDKSTLIECPIGKTGRYVIPSGVTGSDFDAFAGCTGLVRVTIPSSYAGSIYGGSSRRNDGYYSGYAGDEFANCTALTDFMVDPNHETYSSLDGVLFNKDKTMLLRCPTGKSGSYTIPNSVTEIASGAFARKTTDGQACSKLTEITIPDSVTRIGGGAFQDCTGLTQITIPGSIKEIESPAFNRCTGLTRITISNGVTTIGQNEFMGCTALKSISIPTSVTAIGISAAGVFPGCPNLTDIAVDAANKNYSSLDGSLFDKKKTTLLRCPSGKSGTVEIPGTVATIEPSAFIDCKGLTAFTVAADNKSFSSVEGVLFNKDQTTLIRYPAAKAGTYEIPAGVTRIAALAFSGCTGLTDVKLPDSVTWIGCDAFAGCSNLPSSVLVRATPPARPVATVAPPPPPQAQPPGAPPAVPVPGVQPSASVPGQPPGVRMPRPRVVPPPTSGQPQAGVPGGGPVPIPVLTQGDYTYTTNDKGQASITGFNKDFKGELAILDTLGGCPVSGISSRAFATIPGITRIKIPASVASIGDAWGMAFANLPNLTAIEVDPDNKNYSSRDGVLFNKEKTTLIQCPVSKSGTYSIPAGVTDITDGAFLGCTGLTEIMIPSSVSRIGNSAFYQCDGLAAIQVDEANQTYSSLEGGLLSKDQTTLLLCPSARKGDYAIPAKVASINLHAFTSCTDLTRVTIPESVTSISHSSFHNCAGLMAIEVAATNKTYSSLNGVWFNKERTILIRCPRGLIGDYEIPPGVSTIGRYAFSGCSGLTQLGIPESVTAIEYQAFQGCEKLATSIKGLGRINFNASSSYAGMPSAPEPSVPATSTSPGAPPPPPPPRRQIRR